MPVKLTSKDLDTKEVKVIGVLSREPVGDVVGTIPFTKISRSKTSDVISIIESGCHEVVNGINRWDKESKWGIYLRVPSKEEL